tara:strand:+ start:142 stop:819 length:678 start_codon:yes stop_codon:yes gene_type:complete
MKKIYVINHNSLIDNIVVRKRKEILEIIEKNISKNNIEDAIDIGSTEDKGNESSNYIIKNLTNIPKIISLSDQNINDNFFFKNIKKSITEDFSNEEIVKLKSDLVVSNATIEHVGSLENQKKMIQNIINLSKKYFVITTPNRFHPIEFHTKLLFLHWLPKNIYRKICKFIGLKFFSEEDNLNLLSKNDLINLMKVIDFNNYQIFKIKLLGFVSNYILIGKINDSN